MNLPNKLTIFRMMMVPVFIIALFAEWMPVPDNRYWALGIFVFASLTDLLDGYIARSQNLVTDFGKFLDPLADKLLVSAALVALVQLNELPSWVVVIIISREFIVTGYRLLAVEAGIVISASNWGKFKTVSQMAMIVYLLLGFSGEAAEGIKQILVSLATLLTVISAVDYMFKNNKAFNS